MSERLRGFDGAHSLILRLSVIFWEILGFCEGSGKAMRDVDGHRRVGGGRKGFLGG